MKNDNIKKLLNSFELFSELSNDQIDLLTKHSRILFLTKDNYVFNLGDSPQGLYLLMAGQLKVGVVSTQGVEKVISIVTPGESFGETGLFLKQRLPFYAKSINESQVLLLPEYIVDSLLNNYASIARKMHERLSASLHHMIHSVEVLSQQNAIGRFVVYLLQISTNANDAKSFMLPTRKSNIASILNITPETLSRSISTLQKVGLIEIKGGHITILDTVKLRNFLVHKQSESAIGNFDVKQAKASFRLPRPASQSDQADVTA
ncbi:MAG: Crp/Fnr family transcriptional regulator [Methylotenera sp.]